MREALLAKVLLMLEPKTIFNNQFIIKVIFQTKDNCEDSLLLLICCEYL